MGADVPPSSLDIEAELSKLTGAEQIDVRRREQESALARIQQSLVSLSQAWHETSDKRNGALQIVNERVGQLSEAKEAHEAASADQADKHVRNVQFAQRKLAKRQSVLDECSATLAERAGALREAMRARDEITSQLASRPS